MGDMRRNLRKRNAAQLQICGGFPPCVNLNRFFTGTTRALLSLGTHRQGAAMLAAASFQPHRVGEAVGPLNTESWALEASRGTPQHAMKLLDLDSVRSLMLRNLDVCRKRRPTLSGSQVLTHVPEIDSDPYYGAAGVADPSDVNRLLALDVEELVQHTYRLHRERRADAPVRRLSTCQSTLQPLFGTQ